MKHVITITMEQRVIGAPPQVKIDCPPDMPPLQGMSMCLGAQQFFLQAEANLRIAAQQAKEQGGVLGPDGKVIQSVMTRNGTVGSA